MIDSPYIDDDEELPEGDERHVDLVDTSHPITRDLGKLIDALYIVEAELRHQVYRLDNRVKPRTEGERQHTHRLRDGYHESYHNIKTLRRYHEGRKHRQDKTGSAAPTVVESGTGPVFGSAQDDPHGARNG
jgi:hypothetical protein